MTTINNITNYKELVAERTRLEMELQNQKLALKAEIDEAKTKLEPIAYAMSSLGFLKGKDGEQSSLLKKGMNKSKSKLSLGSTPANNQIELAD